MENITFQMEKLSQVKDEVYSLLVEHWEEVALEKDIVPLDPDWEMYQILEDSDKLSITTARKDGKIVGYFAYLIANNLHYKSVYVAEGDIFYIDKAYRRTRLASKLLAESEKNLLNRGVNKVINKTKEHINNTHGVNAGALFEYAGYRKIENIYAKRISNQG